jgi:hypothetical protein
MPPGLPLLLLSSLFLAYSGSLHAQDMPVRVEAVGLLERANAVSHPAHRMPDYRHDITFRAYGVDGSAKDGRFIGTYSGDIERYEWFFGDYHAVSIHYPDKIVQNRDYQPAPRETMEMDKLTPRSSEISTSPTSFMPSHRQAFLDVPPSASSSKP